MSERTHGRRHGRSARIRAGLALGVVGLLGVTGTYAYWSDSVPVSGITITSGSLDLKVNGADSLTNYTGLSLSNMVPGNSVADVITVSNAGTADLTYYATSTASGTLGAALTVKVTGDTSTGGSGTAKTCPGTALATSGSTFGSSLIGTQANPRKLVAGTSEKICLQVTLPSAAASTLQGSSTAVTMTFQANQATS